MRRDIRITEEAAVDLDALVRETYAVGQTRDYFKRHLLRHVEKHGWGEWWPSGPKGYDFKLAGLLLRTYSRPQYMAKRLEQLIDGDYRYWIYRWSSDDRCCPQWHHDLDGIAVPPDHPFWNAFLPPNGWLCGCAVYGARTEKGILRMGGVPGKPLPENWRELPLDARFRGASPTIWQALEAVLNGEVDGL